MTARLRITCIIISAAALLSVRAGDAFAQTKSDAVVFEKHILPIFEARCLKCHGDGKTRGGLDLRRKFKMLEGGDSGPALVAGKPGESILVQKIEAGEMPPEKADRLDARQIELIRRWVAAGAPVAKSPEPALEEKDIVAQVTDEDRRFWSFQAPKRPNVPKVKAADRVRNPIDAFILEKLEAKGLTFNLDPPRGVLLRRLTFDLHGLPPTPEQLSEFVADQRPDAYERLVDRLLTAPEYGERWGRHWLDVAGYADSDGYLAADRLRPEAWRYRDYVIQSLNDDVPYDRFLTEQLAGDELSDWRRADELTPEMKRQLIATGFLRTASDPTYPGYTEPNEIHGVMADTMQIVGTTILGLTMHCARCHTHKFDPISQRDYFSLQTVFLPALDPARWQPSEVRGIHLASEAEKARKQALQQKADARINELKASLNDLTAPYRKRLVRETIGDAAKDAALVDKVIAAILQTSAKQSKEQKDLIHRFALKISLAESSLSSKYPDYKAEADKLQAAIAAEQALKDHHKVVLARALMDLDGKIPEGRVLRRGDYNKPGAVVAPGVPEVLTSKGFKLGIQDSYKTTGRRLTLARWLTDPNHPLTARVQVNRMWATHFGKGIVPTVANFGRSGAKPSHPELLDWLATEFVNPQSAIRNPQSKWSLKHLHRLMVTSTAYRQTSERDPATIKTDPDNILLGAWRTRRHEGEVVRDSVLAISDKLNRERFGPPSPVSQMGDGAVETSDNPAGNRRSVYLIVRRSQHLTMLDLFDTPMMEVNCPERTVSTVPLQALAMLHGPFMERNARAFADRILKAAESDVARLDVAFRLAFAREPRDSERKLIQRYLAMDIIEQTAKDASPARRDEAIRNAWTQVALVLFNSNEFLYVH